ncbi:hypothetical protein [Acidovorax sp. SUPP3334]|uniref:hypothetical protein n=1 Tax=Acidovorax sp. SUPP3334 TaxID=2920881 RepID=UPI0023DE4C1C|nr:hypothetical protein AVHM3334_11945 [Acidovorax sp. SUPP3334]
MVQAAYRVGSHTLKNRWLWGIAMAAFVAIFALQVPFPAIVLLAAAVGHVGGKVAPQAFTGGGHGESAAPQRPGALIDDDTPAPAHALFSWARLCKVVAIGLGLWLVALGSLWALFGWNAVPTQMGRALTRVGGARLSRGSPA